MVSIGNIKLKYGLMLAPMAGVTDRSFRRICKRFGAEYMVSEMISSKAIIYHDTKTPELAENERIGASDGFADIRKRT